MTALVVALTVAVGLLGLLVVGLLRSHAEILRQLHELGAGREDTAPGAVAPSPAAPDLPVRDGVVAPAQVAGTPGHDLAGVRPGSDAIAVRVVGAAHDTLLAFLSTGCSTCEGFWQVLAQPGATGLPDGVRLVVVAKGPELESESALAAVAPARLPLVMSTQAWEDYGVPGSPYFVLVEGRTGRVSGEGSASAWEQVARLVREASADGVLLRDRHGHQFAAGPGAVGGAAGGAAAAAGEDRGDGPHREARTDRELLAAGIAPGHHSLYATAEELAEDARAGS